MALHGSVFCRKKLRNCKTQLQDKAHRFYPILGAGLSSRRSWCADIPPPTPPPPLRRLLESFWRHCCVARGNGPASSRTQLQSDVKQSDPESRIRTNQTSSSRTRNPRFGQCRFGPTPRPAPGSRDPGRGRATGPQAYQIQSGIFEAEPAPLRRLGLGPARGCAQRACACASQEGGGGKGGACARPIMSARSAL